MRAKFSLPLFFWEKKTNIKSDGHYLSFEKLFDFYKLSATHPDRINDPLLGQDPPVENRWSRARHFLFTSKHATDHDACNTYWQTKMVICETFNQNIVGDSL